MQFIVVKSNRSNIIFLLLSFFLFLIPLICQYQNLFTCILILPCLSHCSSYWLWRNTSSLCPVTKMSISTLFLPRYASLTKYVLGINFVEESSYLDILMWLCVVVHFLHACHYWRLFQPWTSLISGSKSELKIFSSHKSSHNLISSIDWCLKF